jgi:hypothetical protein
LTFLEVFIKVLHMPEEAGTEIKSIIPEIRQKIRQLNVIAAFIVITLLAVILRYLFKPLSDALDFLPDISVTLIIIITLILTFIGFYMWAVVTRRIIKSIEKYRNRLNQIFAITKDIREEMYGDILLGKIMDYSISLTESDSGAILLMEDQGLVFKIVKSEKGPELVGKVVPPGMGIAGWVAENSMPLRIADAKSDGRFSPEFDSITEYEPKSVLCVPLITKAGVAGVLELLKKQAGHFRASHEELIVYIADQAAASLMRTRFYEDQKNYEIHVTDMLLEAIDFQIPEKTGHSKRVAKYSNIIAKAINMSDEKKKRLYLASLLHDVGFLRIRADEIFNREYYVKHPAIGYEMISPINFYADIAPFILHHHERYDGTGYPQGIKGEAIPLEARIIAIAEAFDAMVSDTSYKLPLNFDEAVEELKRHAGTQFDFWLVDTFVSNILSEHIQ